MKRIPSRSNSIVKMAFNTLVPLVLKHDSGIDSKQLAKDGADFDKLGRLIPMPRGVKTQAFRVNHIDCEWLAPPKAKDGLLFYIHGGGYCVGSIDSHRSFVGHLAKKLNRKAI